MTYDTVVFDLGNVLIAWEPALAFHGVLDPDDVPAFLEEVDFPAWNHAQDSGRSWADGVADLASRFPHHRVAIEAYVPNFASTLREMPAATAVLHELAARGVRLLALTNWSAELFGHARDRFAFLEEFEGIVVSGQERVAKPDRRVFEVLLRRYEVDPGHAVFVDDSAVNVAAACAVGLRGVRFVDAPALRRELVAAGLLPPDT